MSRFVPLIRARLADFLRDSSGATAAEFALVVPVFLILVFSTINMGLAMSAVNQVHYAAERSARCLATNVSGDCTTANIDTYAKGLYNGPGLTAFSFTPADEACGKRVTGTGGYEILTGFDSTAVTITATACYPII